jgi:putative cardiolipin synthase
MPIITRPSKPAVTTPATSALTPTAAPTTTAAPATTATTTTTTAPATTAKDRAQVLGNVATRDPFTALPKPTSAAHAYDTLPCTSAGAGKVRRFADDNVNAWNMVLSMLRGAEKTLDFSFFTIEKDPYGWAFLGGALYAQMRGVETRGMTDWSSNARGRGFVSIGLGQEYLQEIVDHGGKVCIFNSPMKRMANMVRDGFSENGAVNYGLVGCNHDKMMVVDHGTPKAQGQTGGRNIAGAYHQDAADNAASWRDDTLHIVGAEACEGFATTIAREFGGRAAKVIEPDIFNLNNRSRLMLATYALMEEWVDSPPMIEAEKEQVRDTQSARDYVSFKLVDATLKRLDKMVAALPEAKQAKIPKSLSPGEYDRIRELARELVKDTNLCGSKKAYEALDGFMDADVKIVDQIGAASAAPGARHNEMAPALKHLFDGARNEIVIQNPYVVLTEPMILFLEDAAKRGVSITIVTNSPASTDSVVTQGFFLNDWPALLARVPTASLFVATGERKLHAKAFTIDGEIAGDMSYNADLLSGFVNGEIGAIVKSKESAEHLNKAIIADLDDPKNGFDQWTIQRDATGRAVLDSEGQPIVTRGPKDVISKKVMRAYGPIQLLASLFTKTEAGAPLAHPSVQEAWRRTDGKG